MGVSVTEQISTMRHYLKKGVMAAMEKYQEFWNWFEDNEHKFFDLTPDNADMLLSKINTRIRRVDKRLSVLFSAVLIEGKKEIVITTEGNKEAFPIVFKLTDYAPELERWRVRSLKPRIPNFESPGLKIGNKTLRANDIYFTYSVSNKNKLDVELFVKNYEGDYPETCSVFLMLCDMLLGEYDTSDKIGMIEVQRLISKKGLLPLAKIVDIVDGMKIVN